jgi:phosphoglycolate phosphatase
MKKYTTIIWDLDGTLADTSEGIFNSIRYVQEKLSLPAITEEQYRFHIGPPIADAYERNFNLTDKLLEDAIGFHKEYAMRKGLYQAVLYPDVCEILSYLKAKRYAQGVATLKLEDVAKEMLIHLKINCFMDTVCGGLTNLHLSKAQLIEKCLNQLNKTKEEALFIGDSVYDALGAEQAGIDFIAVTYGFGFQNMEEVNEFSNVASIMAAKELVTILT